MIKTATFATNKHMKRFGQILLGLLVGVGLMAALYGVYQLLGVEDIKRYRVSDYTAEVALHAWWDGDGANIWSHDAKLDSFGVKKAVGQGVDSLIIKGTLDDTTRVVAVPLALAKQRSGEE